MLSALFLVVATVIGVWLRDGYDHVAYTISELYEVGAPNAAALMVLFTAYHALVIPLAIGLHRGLSASPSVAASQERLPGAPAAAFPREVRWGGGAGGWCRSRTCR